MFGKRWDDPLKQILSDKEISGYAFLTEAGNPHFVYGDLKDEMLNKYTDALFDETKLSLPALGHVLIVHGRGAASSGHRLYAVSKGKEVGVVGYQLLSGVLIISYKKPQISQCILPRIEKVVASMT